jgi:hypothetical protein
MKKIILLFLIIVVAVGAYFIFIKKDNLNQETEDTEKITCGIEQCHGLEVTCGQNVPEFCTAIYQLGDFCQQFVNCRTVENECKMMETEKFEACKTCVSKCERIEGVEAFDCEAECRQQFE